MDKFEPLQDNLPEIADLGIEIETPEEKVVRIWDRPLVAFLVEVLETLVLAAILYFMIDFVVARVRVENVSMKPTLHPGEFLLVNKMAYKLGDMNHGDIVIFHHSEEEDYIKRLIGLPGDNIEITEQKVIVNGQELNEPYISAPPMYTGSWVVPANSIFVLGDNRNQSSDSHSWGFVPFDKVIGKALAIYWPLENAQMLTHPDIVNAASAP